MNLSELPGINRRVKLSNLGEFAERLSVMTNELRALRHVRHRPPENQLSGDQGRKRIASGRNARDGPRAHLLLAGRPDLGATGLGHLSDAACHGYAGTSGSRIDHRELQ